MVESAKGDELIIQGINAPVKTREDSIKEPLVAERERQVMIGKAFEKFLQIGYGGRGDFQEMLASSVVMSDALKLVKIDGKEITPGVLDKIMFDLTRMQLDMLTPNRAEFADLRKGWRDYSGRRTMPVDFGRPFFEKEERSNKSEFVHGRPVEKIIPITNIPPASVAPKI